MRKNIILIDSDINHVGVFKHYVFSCKYNIDISKIYLDYNNEAVMGIIDNNYDIVIINYDLNKEFTINILKYFKDNKISKEVIIITDEDDLILNSIYDISCYIKQNITGKVLNEVFSNAFGGRKMKEDSLVLHTSNILHELGIPSSIKGYTFIRDAVTIIYENNDIVISVTKDIYPTIALKYNTMASRVARAIKHAIEVAWNRGDIDVITKYFGNSVSAEKSRPTNSEFIFTIADYLKITN